MFGGKKFRRVKKIYTQKQKQKRGKQTSQKIEPKPLNFQNKYNIFYKNISELSLEEIQPWSSTSTDFDHVSHPRHLKKTSQGLAIL